jgi:hypothetical protein
MGGIKMIGFNALGQLGRLGNQMFQFASLKGIAQNNGYQYCVPPSQNQNEYRDHQLFGPFKLSNTTQLNIQLLDSGRPTISENSFCFDERLFNNCPDWVNLQGYFQSEKYFKNIKKEIKKDFEFIDDISIPCQESISELDKPIALHIRRTDYVTNPNHSALDLDYYHRALKLFDNEQQVIIFSDEPEWCKNQELFESDRFLVSEGQSNYMDMCLMTLCSGHIIANSSFSWWGAWLAKSEKVIAPVDWFKGSNNENLDTKDLFPETWTVI